MPGIRGDIPAVVSGIIDPPPGGIPNILLELGTNPPVSFSPVTIGVPVYLLGPGALVAVAIDSVAGWVENGSSLDGITGLAMLATDAGLEMVCNADILVCGPPPIEYDPPLLARKRLLGDCHGL
jgi:hypothetical protein